MPDTGAPWDIPYLDGTEFVKDYPQASEDLADAVAAGLSAAGNPGIGSNVVQTLKTDTFTTSSNSFVSVTGAAVTITPSTDTSRVLVIAYVAIGDLASSTSHSAHVRITGGNAGNYVGDAAGSRVQAAASTGARQANFLTENAPWFTTVTLVDSPATASAVTYQLEARRSSTGTTATIGRSGIDTNADGYGRYPTILIAIEVAP